MKDLSLHIVRIFLFRLEDIMDMFDLDDNGDEMGFIEALAGAMALIELEQALAEAALEAGVADEELQGLINSGQTDCDCGEEDCPVGRRIRFLVAEQEPEETNGRMRNWASRLKFWK